MYNFIDLFVAFSEALLPQFLSIGVDVLEFLQPEPHASNISRVRSLIG